ncbi:MAG: hypothetical protein O3A85_13535 [Proteobacteria bacterium]|nr:hypothetical protein [Pseudomonadota bacterium]
MRKILGNVTLLIVGLALGILFAEGVGRVLFPEWRDFYSDRFMASTYVPGYGKISVYGDDVRSWIR